MRRGLGILLRPSLNDPDHDIVLRVVGAQRLGRELRGLGGVLIAPGDHHAAEKPGAHVEVRDLVSPLGGGLGFLASPLTCHVGKKVVSINALRHTRRQLHRFDRRGPPGFVSNLDERALPLARGAQLAGPFNRGAQVLAGPARSHDAQRLRPEVARRPTQEPIGRGPWIAFAPLADQPGSQFAAGGGDLLAPQGLDDLGDFSGGNCGDQVAEQGFLGRWVSLALDPGKLPKNPIAQNSLRRARSGSSVKVGC
ncbi:MAG: hypothetical protein HYR88_07485 [Verrucomicrobia bacterium]|nr:hypothetical protein [Verrucomicrobiota bacterium]